MYWRKHAAKSWFASDCSQQGAADRRQQEHVGVLDAQHKVVVVPCKQKNNNNYNKQQDIKNHRGFFSNFLQCAVGRDGSAKGLKDGDAVALRHGHGPEPKGVRTTISRFLFFLAAPEAASLANRHAPASDVEALAKSGRALRVQAVKGGVRGDGVP